MSGIVTEKEYEIQYYEIDYKKRLLMTSLMQYLGDIATRQSEDLGVGINYLNEHGIAWVLYKWNIHLDKHPLYGEKIKISTKPHSFKKFYAYRTFQITNNNKEVIGWANSVWFLIDVNKRKAIRVKEDMYKAYGIDDNKNNVLDIKKISLPSNIDIEKSFQVRYSDIDTNRHVNNVKYLEWAIETIPFHIFTNYVLKDINIIYEKETTYGEVITVLTEAKNEEDMKIFIHKIIDKKGTQLALLQTNWEREEGSC